MTTNTNSKFKTQASNLRFLPSFMWLFVLMLVAFPLSVSAYYYVPEDQEPTVRLKADAEKHDISKNTKEFALFSNADAPESSGVTYIIPGSDRFVPADVVPANQFLYLSMQKPIRTDSALSGMLYANLKLTRLIGMYTELQKNASELLSGLSVPVVESTPISISSAGSSQSLEQKREALTAAHRSVSRRFSFQSAEAPNGQSETAASADHVETLTTLVTRLRTTDETSLEGLEPRFLSVGGESTSFSDNGAGQGAPLTNGQTAGDTSLPWIFEMGLKLIKFFFSHKIETIIIGAIFMALIMLITAIGRR